MAKQKIKIIENIVTANLYEAIGIDPLQQSTLPKIVIADGCSIKLIAGKDNQDTKLKSVKFKGFGKIYSESIKPLQIETIKVGDKKIEITEFMNIKSIERSIDIVEIQGGEDNEYDLLRLQKYPVDHLEAMGGVDDQI